MKRTRPQDARRELRAMWSKVAVYSCADGTFRIEPQWRKKYQSPGLFGRMHAAVLVLDVLSLTEMRIDWKKRAANVSFAASNERSK